MTQDKKVLVVYYSRSGITREAAVKLSAELKCDIEEIYDTSNRKGILGFLKSGRDAMKERATVIKELKYNPRNYDIIIIGTPVWASNMTPAVRTYIIQNMENIKCAAFFCTFGGSGDKKTLNKMKELYGKGPVNSISINQDEVKNGTYIEKAKEFAKKIH